MIKNCLLEMTLFSAGKETDNKLRWDTEVEGTKFSLYIPKWRVPSPWPARVWVDVAPRRAESDDLPNLAPDDVACDPSLRHEPIIATVIFDREHTETIRFQPVGDEKHWEIGMPYIPKSLVPDGGQRIRIIVLWDPASRGAFHANMPSTF